MAPKRASEIEAGEEGVTTHEDKVAHVLAAKQDRDHGCHWPGCSRQVPPAMWGCRMHWLRLPLRLRSLIWRSYAPGQESGDASISPAYFEAAKQAQQWIEEQTARPERRPPAQLGLSLGPGGTQREP